MSPSNQRLVLAPQGRESFVDFLYFLESMAVPETERLTYAAMLMGGFQKGRNYVVRLWQKQGLTNFVVPRLGVLILSDAPSDQLRLPVSGCTPDGLKLFLMHHFLYHFSSHEMGSVRTISVFSEDIYYEGYPEDFARLLGVEAMHYAAHIQANKTTDASADLVTPASLAEHDATGERYGALEMQVQFAYEEAMPAPTQTRLAARLEAARAIREKRVEV